MQFSDIYSWCTSLGDCLTNGGENQDFTDYYTDYFNETSVCSNIFWIGLGIAAVLALIFYFGICNFCFSLSKRWMWLCVLVITFAATLFTTMKMVCGTYTDDGETSTGIFKSAYNTTDRKLDESTDPDARKEVNLISKSFMEMFSSEDNSETMSSLPLELGLVNGGYALLGFIILSFVAKRFTKHGSSIPL